MFTVYTRGLFTYLPIVREMFVNKEERPDITADKNSVHWRKCHMLLLTGVGKWFDILHCY